MAKYLVIAPDKDMIHLCPANYGMKTYKHGTYMNDDLIASMYPNIFVKIPDGVEVKVETKVKETTVKETKPVLLSEKKKRGRPAKPKEEKKPKKNSIFKRLTNGATED